MGAQQTKNMENAKNATISTDFFFVFNNGNNCMPKSAIQCDIQILNAVPTARLCNIHRISFWVYAYRSSKTKEKSRS